MFDRNRSKFCEFMYSDISFKLHSHDWSFHMFVQLAMEMLRVKINFLSIILSQLVGRRRCLMPRLKELKTIIQAKVKLTAKVETKVN